MFSNVRLYLSPFFLYRYYLKRDIKTILQKYKFTGSVIDIGCGSKPYKPLFTSVKEYKGIDFNNFSINKDFKNDKPDIYFSKTYRVDFRLPFRANQFDNAVAFQVLEHHKYPNKLLKEMSRIVKPNGYMLLSFPFLEGIHEEPNDFYRLTIYALRNHVSENNGNIVYVKTEGSLFSTISMLLNEYINNFAGKNKTAFYTTLLIYLPFLLFEYLSLVLDKVFKSDKIFINYLVLIKNEKDK